MVSEKTVILLITIAILLSVVSVAVTISTINTSMVPEPPRVETHYGEIVSDNDRGQVGLIINPRPGE